MNIPDAEFETCDGPYAGDGEGWNVSNSTGSGSFDLYTGTQQSVNTFFAQLEVQTGMCEPLELAEKMGIKLPVTQQVPSWILGVVRRQPARRWRRPTPRSLLAASTATPSRSPRSSAPTAAR